MEEKRIEETNKAIDKRMMNDKYANEYNQEWYKVTGEMGKVSREENLKVYKNFTEKMEKYW